MKPGYGTKVLFVFGAIFAASFLFFNQKALAATYTWDGGGSTNNWSECANWSSDICPGAADIASFDATSTKDATIDASFAGTLDGLRILSGYTGTVTQGRSITVNNTGYSQASGTFTGSSDVMWFGNGGFTLSGGTFTATSGTLTVERDFTVTGGTFNHNNGLVATSGGLFDNTVFSCNNITFNSVKLAQGGNTTTFNSDCVIPLAATSQAATLTNNGTINFTGNWAFTGNYIQNIGAVLNVSGTSIDINDGSMTFNGGTFTGNVTTINIERSLNNSGNVLPNGLNIIADGNNFFDDNATFTCGTASFGSFSINAASSVIIGASCIISLGNSPTWTVTTVTNNGTLNVGTGTFTVNGSLVNAGTISTSLSKLDLVDGSYTSNAGSLTMSTPAIEVGRSFTYSAGTIPSGISLTADGPNFGTMTCGSASANITLFIINKNWSDRSIAIDSSCTLPLGDNPTGIGSFTNSGTLVVGTGTWTQQGDITNAGTIITSLSSFVVDVGNCCGGSFTNSGTLTMSNPDITIGENFTYTSGTLPGNINLTVNSGNSSTFTCTTPLTFSSVVISKSFSDRVLINGSGCAMPLGNNPVSVGTVTNNGTMTAGTGTWTLTGNLTNNGTFSSDLTVLDINQGSCCAGNFTSSGGSMTLATDPTFRLNANFTYTSGTLPSSLALIFDSAETTILTCGSYSPKSVTFNKPSGTHAIGSSCVIQESFNRLDGNIGNPSNAYTLSVLGDITILTTDQFGGSNLTLQSSGGRNTTIYSSATISSKLSIDKSNKNRSLDLISNMVLGSTLAVNSGIFDQSSAFNLITGGTVTIGAAGVWQNRGDGDVTLAGNVTNNGYIRLDSVATGCGNTQNILVRSTSAGVQRIWSGTGKFKMHDLDVQDQGGSVTAHNSINRSNNSWTFTAPCPSEKIWDGGGSDNNWNTAENWTGDSVPLSSYEVVFDGTSSKDAIINVAVEVTGIEIVNGYSGIISQANSMTFTVGAPGYDQRTGTFLGSDSTIDINGPFNLTGGSFSSTSGSLKVDDNFNVTGGNFSHNGGTFVYEGSQGQAPGSTIDLQDVLVLNDFTVNRETSNFGQVVLGFGDKILVAGNFNYASGQGINSGIIEVQGDVAIGASAAGGTTELWFSGNEDQNYTSNGGDDLDGDIYINKLASAVLLGTNAQWNSSGQDLVIYSGRLDQGASHNLLTGAITLGSGGELFDIGSGDLTLGGNVYNLGNMVIDGSGAGCGGADNIAITSSPGGVQRTWSGSGIFNIYDAIITDMSGSITAYSSTNTSNNSWTFSACDIKIFQSTYRWYGNVDAIQPNVSLAGENTQAQVAAPGTPVRLRVNSSVVDGDLTAGSQAISLQYSTSVFGPWKDVNKAWWNNSWINRRKIYFDNSSSNEDLIDFPVLISLNSGNIDYNKTKGAGEDIRFVDADGTALNYEIEKWDEADTSLIWVKVPQINAASTSDYVWIYYNNPAASDAQSASGVWNSNYEAIWHLPDGATLSGADSTSNTNTLTSSGASATSGKIGGGAAFVSSSSQYMSKASFSLGATDVTASAWVYTSSGSQNGMIIEKDNVNADWELYFEGSSLWLRGGSTIAITTTAPSSGAWHYVAGTISGTTGTIYIDGRKAATGTVTAIANTTNTLNLGRYGSGGGGYYYNGSIDEARISSVSRSADWIEAEYKTMTQTFGTFGDEEIVSFTPTAEWSFKDNGSVSDGAALGGLLLSDSDVSASYQESNPSAANPNTISSGNEAEWDFSLMPSGATAGSTYYFRLVRSSGVPLNFYNNYAAISVGAFQGADPRTIGAPGAGTLQSGGGQGSGDGIAWWNTAWSVRKKITIDNTASSENLNDFPLLVSLTSSEINYSKTRDAGQDLRFVDADNTILLNYEIEKWDEAGTSLIWVKVPQIAASSGSGYIWMYYNNQGADDAQEPESVWDSNYLSVWHMADGTTLSLEDSSRSGNTPSAGTVTAGTGKVDGGAVFNGGTGMTSQTYGNPTTFTLEAWIKPNAAGGVVFSESDLGSWHDSQLEVETNGSIKSCVWIGSLTCVTSATGISFGSWYYVVTRYSQSTTTLTGLVNGIGTSNASVTKQYPSSVYYRLGYADSTNGGNGSAFSGTIDEVRISNTARSDEWIEAVYRNINSQITSFGSEETYARSSGGDSGGGSGQSGGAESGGGRS